MTCIATTLTIISVFTGGVWNDISVSTNSNVLTRKMNEQVATKVEMLSDTKRKTETFTVACGQDVHAATASILETL